MKVPSKRGTPWTADEIKYLEREWGETSLRTIAAKLGRTRLAIYAFATVKLGLDPRQHGLLQVEEIARRSGYETRTIRVAIKRLGITMRILPTALPGSSNPQRGVEEEQVEQIYTYLKEHTDGSYHLLEGSKRSPASAWGTGGKPASCIDCKRTDRPHYCKGRCKACHSKDYRQKNHEKVRAYERRSDAKLGRFTPQEPL